MLAPSVQDAISELSKQLGDERVHSEEDGEGGAHVKIKGVLLPPPYHSPIWLAFHIPFTYPQAEIYPFYAPSPSDLRSDGVKSPLTPASYRGSPVTQISRKPNKKPRTVEFETVIVKFLKVVSFLEESA